MNILIEQFIHVKTSLNGQLYVLIEVHSFEVLVGLVVKHFETAQYPRIPEYCDRQELLIAIERNRYVKPLAKLVCYGF